MVKKSESVKTVKTTKTEKTGKTEKTKASKNFLGWRFSSEQIEFLKKFPLYFFAPYVGIRFFDWSALTSAIAAFESSALAALGYANERLGSVILARGGSSGGNNAFDLIVDCSGVVMIIMFLALYYSTEIPSRKKPRGPWVYLPVLFAFNLFRLFLTLAVGISFGGGALQATHFALWFVDSGVVVLAWAHAKNVELA